jgi:EAL domain-containing protein (putative c-di-GMP-specific phosphodiesterase class I)
MVDAIIHLGSSLSLETTAEGIETDTNVEWLATQGCNFGQGYLFGRPMDKDDAQRCANRASDAGTVAAVA